MDNRAQSFQNVLDHLPTAEIRLDGEFHRRNYAKRDLGTIPIRQLSINEPAANHRNFIAIDVETTGISLTGNSVIEVSAIRFEDFEPVEKFSTLLHPKKPIPAEATAIHHITNEMVQDAPAFYEIIPSLDQFIGNLPIVAHNAKFDVSHLYASGLDSMANKAIYDTLQISRQQNPGLANHKLATSCAAHGIYFANAHRADADTLACGQLFVKMLMKVYQCNTLEKLQQAAQIEDWNEYQKHIAARKNWAAIQTLQWVCFGVGLFFALVFLKRYTVSGILFAISAFAVSPLIGKLKFMPDNRVLRTILQFAAAFLLFMIGAVLGILTQ